MRVVVVVFVRLSTGCAGIHRRARRRVCTLAAIAHSAVVVKWNVDVTPLGRQSSTAPGNCGFSRTELSNCTGLGGETSSISTE